MSHIIKLLTITFFSLSISSFAHASIGLLVHYGVTPGEPEKVNAAYADQLDGPKIDQQDYLGLDLVYHFKRMPLGFGLRHEQYSETLTDPNDNFDLAVTRLSLLLDYRWHTKRAYWGPVFTYGLSNDLEFKVPTDPEEYTSGGDSSYSLGFGAGFRWKRLLLGAELGYLNLVFDEMTEIGGAPADKNSLFIDEVDLSGTYYKLLVGFQF